MDQIDKLRRDSRLFGRVTLALLIATALLLLVPTLAALGMSAARHGTWATLLRWSGVIWLPSIFYLYALWAIRRLFVAYAQGGLIGPAVAAGCTQAGVALALGGTTSAVIVPNLLRLIDHASSPGGQPVRGSFLHFDLAYLAVGVVGLAMVLLGRLLHQAAAAHAEAARLKGELEGFF